MLARAIVAASASVKARLCKLQKRSCAVRERTALRRQAVLVLARHLAEREREPVGSKHRVVAEAALSARGPHQGAVDPRLEFLGVPVGPGKAQRTDEMRTPVGLACRALLPQQALDLLHRRVEILVWSRPAHRPRARNRRQTPAGLPRSPRPSP